MAVPKIIHVADKVRNMGPTVPAPEDILAPGPTPTSGMYLYRKGDPMPINEARARGYEVQVVEEVDEPGPRHSSTRGRTIRIADRAGEDRGTV